LEALWDTKCDRFGPWDCQKYERGLRFEKARSVQKCMFDLRVDFCHLDPKSRDNQLKHFRTLIVTGLGLGIEKIREGTAL